MKTEQQEMNTPIGQAGIKNWNSTWKHHHLPIEFKKRIRKAAIDAGEWRVRYQMHSAFMPFEVFDHWGSFIPEGEVQRVIASMPYSRGDDKARAWAERHGMTVTITDNSPYGHGTHLYIFTP